MVRDSVYVAVQTVAVVTLVAGTVGLFLRTQRIAAFVVTVAALVITVSAVVLGLPSSVTERLTLPRVLRVVFASQTRTVITVLAVGLLLVAGGGHVYLDPSPVTTSRIDTADVSFDVTSPNGTLDIRYVAGPPLDLSALSVRVDGRPVSADAALETHAPGLSSTLRPGDSIVVGNRTDGEVSWTSLSVTLTTPENETLLLATASREVQTVTPRRTTRRAAGTTVSGGPDPCCSAALFVRAPHAIGGSS